MWIANIEDATNIITNLEIQQSIYACGLVFFRLPYVHNKICPTQNLVLQHRVCSDLVQKKNDEQKKNSSKLSLSISGYNWDFSAKR